MKKNLIIAIDGPSGSGKSTTGKALANKLGYLYIDTGAMYRAAALAAIRANIGLSEEEKIISLVKDTNINLKGSPYKLQVFLNGEDVTENIRTPEVSQSASIISAIGGVRQALVARQQEMGKQGGVVLDGRDIGTHVFPNADAKFFLIADVYERARRRNLEEVNRGENLTLEETLKEIEERDQRDEQRTYSPLRPAEDSIKLDTSNLTPNLVVEKILEHLEPKLNLMAKPLGIS
ncbi:MAG: (d)CMP kinase [Blastocatellia bacterium]|nr:(d)CMP kinase [Blastocatellia bacterium]MBN8721494.1 (d)CMP kinase [Acidobacteriota bacterium]